MLTGSAWKHVTNYQKQAPPQNRLGNDETKNISTNDLTWAVIRTNTYLGIHHGIYKIKRDVTIL